MNPNNLALDLILLLIGSALGAAAMRFSQRRTFAALDEQRRLEFAMMAERIKSELHEANAAIAREQRDQFLELAGQRLGAVEERSTARLTELVAPVREKLLEFDKVVREIEGKRTEAYTLLTEQVKQLAQRESELHKVTNALQTRTSDLVSALRNPTVRGRWGEVQLRRVVEMAGMQEHCDFEEQVQADATTRARPDLTIHLDSDHKVFVDAKVPLNAYLDAVESPDERVRAERLRDHAIAFRQHIDALARRDYASADGSADIVVMFVPGEAFLSAACMQDPTLLEDAMEKRILVTSPLTLMALLRSYAAGWKSRSQEQHVLKVAELGRELYDAVRVFGSHLAKLGASLEQSVKHFNGAVGSAELNVFPKGRRMNELASFSQEPLPELKPFDARPRAIVSKEFLLDDDAS